MDRGGWQATVHAVARVGHDLAAAWIFPCLIETTEAQRSISYTRLHKKKSGQAGN